MELRREFAQRMFAALNVGKAIGLTHRSINEQRFYLAGAATKTPLLKLFLTNELTNRYNGQYRIMLHADKQNPYHKHFFVGTLTR